MSTKIEWVINADGTAGMTVNPIKARDKKHPKRVGHFCERVSPGCANCYASRWQLRLKMFPFEPKYRERIEHFLDPKALSGIERRKKPTTYFWEDMSDLFGEWVTNEWLDECFGTMARTPHHTHMLLTKRPERVAEYFAMRANRRAAAKRRHPDRALSDWPLPNIKIGISAENQTTLDERLPILLHLPAAYRYVSYEPALAAATFKWAACSCADKGAAFKEKAHEQMCALYGGPGKTRPLGELLNLVIVGGESGPGARPMYLQWPASVIRQGDEQGFRVFVKQLGAFPTQTPIGTKEFERAPTRVIRLKLVSRKGNNPAEWPAELRHREGP